MVEPSGRRSSGFAALLVAVALLSISCTEGEADLSTPADQSASGVTAESILDRVVRIEPKLLTEIPATPRWCDRLKLASRRVDAGGAQLHVEEQGEGVPLVLINGGPGGTHHYFHPWFERARGYARVIYYDQRGCGLSDFEPGDDGYSVEQAADDLDALRQALGVKKWVLLGYSYGGFLAQLYTVRHPRNVAGLILVGSSAGMSVEIGRSRQQEFLSDEERARMKMIREELQQLSQETDMPRRRYVQLLLYNNFINGDWKRQQFYKPDPERMAQIALYEWDHDGGFNGTVGQSKGGIDFTGIFDKSPIPTLILEGKWDLTWNEKKAEILAGNHPNGKLVLFENAGHGIYDEEPDRFFEVLEEFLTDLPEVPLPALAEYAKTVDTWDRQLKASPGYALARVGWGWHSSRELAEKYNRDWLRQFEDTTSLLRVGFALYDVESYEESATVFERMEQMASTDGNAAGACVAVIWQAQMLDLLGRRDEAIERYRRAAEMNLDNTWSHGQYGMKYKLGPYARTRMEIPFERIPNQDPS
jgi:proline iminopeptidase